MAQVMGQDAQHVPAQKQFTDRVWLACGEWWWGYGRIGGLYGGHMAVWLVNVVHRPVVSHYCTVLYQLASRQHTFISLVVVACSWQDRTEIAVSVRLQLQCLNDWPILVLGQGWVGLGILTTMALCVVDEVPRWQGDTKSCNPKCDEHFPIRDLQDQGEAGA